MKKKLSYWHKEQGKIAWKLKMPLLQRVHTNQSDNFLWKDNQFSRQRKFSNLPPGLQQSVDTVPPGILFVHLRKMGTTKGIKKYVRNSLKWDDNWFSCKGKHYKKLLE